MPGCQPGLGDNSQTTSVATRSLSVKDIGGKIMSVARQRR